MYNKEELLAKDSLELENIAKELDVQFNPEDNKESVVYAILDKQAEMPNVPAKRKRTRITKKEDHVYSVSGAEGANYDVMKIMESKMPSSLFLRNLVVKAPLRQQR